MLSPIPYTVSRQSIRQFLPADPRGSTVVLRRGLDNFEADHAWRINDSAIANQRIDRAVGLWHTTESTLSCVFGQHGVATLHECHGCRAT